MKTVAYMWRLCASAFCVLAAVACTDELELPGSGMPQELEQYYFILGDGNLSRSISYESDEHSEFSGGELLGCFALDASGKPVSGEKPNACYSVSVIVSNDAAMNGRRVLVPNGTDDKLDKGHSCYLFYYPYNPEITSLDQLKNLTYSVMADQSKDGCYEQSDLLWDMARPTDRYCIVEMDHAMANIIISIDNVEYDVDKGAVVLSQPLTATGINLTAPDINAMRDARGGYYYSVEPDQTKHDIQAAYARYPSSNDRFRAAVPANRTLAGGTEIIKLWSKETGAEKTFTLKQDITLEPGRNYIFTLIKKGAYVPDPMSDQSWVLDVLDPQTGKSVGLLCREYLRYQRSQDVDAPTTPDDGSGEPVLNSQAWVFYNLQADNKTPELSKGVVLRFVYDVRTNLSDVTLRDDPFKKGKGGMAWPYPHKYHSTQIADGDGDKGFGLFLAEHGHRWVYNVSTGYGETGEKLGDYNMHGGTVYWDGTNNEISQFVMPERDYLITNEMAYKHGHIAIPADGGEPYVSYSEINEGGATDINGNGVGFLMPHCLVDHRRNNAGKLRVVRYPLVKIGFNQFWMQKSLRAKTFTDGTPLECYNIIQESPNIKIAITGIDHNNSPLVMPGYIYPMCGDGTKENWCDPYSIYNGDEDALDNDPDYDLTLLYNYNTFCDSRIVPKSVESISEYYAPGFPRYIALHHYLAANSIAKMMSNGIQTRDGDVAVETQVEAFKKGKYFVMRDLNTYPGNISGFNLRSFAPWDFEKKQGWDLIGSSSGFWLKTDDYKRGMVMADYYSYTCWNTGPLEKIAFFNNDIYNYGISASDQPMGNGLTRPEHSRTICFAQIRLVLQFKNQSGSSIPTTAPSRSVRGASEADDVYVAVE